MHGLYIADIGDNQFRYYIEIFLGSCQTTYPLTSQHLTHSPFLITVSLCHGTLNDPLVATV